MGKLRFVASLTTNDNDLSDGASGGCARSCQRLDVELEIIYAENDAILQSQQLFKIIQSNYWFPSRRHNF